MKDSKDIIEQTVEQKIKALVPGIKLVCAEHGTNCDPKLTSSDLKALVAKLEAAEALVGEYVEMLADADMIRIPTDTNGHFTTIHKNESNGTLTQHLRGKWEVGANYDEIYFDTPLEAYAAIRAMEAV